ncbi:MULTISPECIES: hypothetical protein [Stenotrophomonas]|uniref:Uncharacterized protein n=1 Tax=Stenotrophomonas lactitubi TaxID=2045214 RepID=A0AAW4GCS5_9GAMM|nr:MULTISPECIES: hypothetical protein [Stenotrophomonas]MBM9911897.1 hypothetical protein [Stenotrophomonas lactitubi]MBM9921065.1 hypothetical protein [Stenotrophomonas lactitubi]MBM9939872.1 hypothetical protein [Stenotrophomonas lactitubi]
MNVDRSSDMLFAAANTARELENAGIDVLAHYSNGRRPVLIITQPPADIEGHLKRWGPNGSGGRDRVLAAEYQGLQLEWTERAPVVVTIRTRRDTFESREVVL